MTQSRPNSHGLLRDCVAALAITADNDEGIVAVLDLVQGALGAAEATLAVGRAAQDLGEQGGVRGREHGG